MTDMGAVGALPGGQELVALAGKVKGDPGAIRAVGTRWRGAASGSAGPLNALGVLVSGVDTAWNGASADAFVAYMRRYGRAGEALHDALANCANSLDAVAGAVEVAGRNVGGVCDDLLAWVGEYRRRNPQATEEQLKPGITEQVKAAVSLAQGQVETAETAVSTAQREIGKYLDEIAPEFAEIPAAVDQTFVPGPGQSTEWVPVPEDKLRTLLAGTDGSQGADGGDGSNGGGSGGGGSGGGGGGSGGGGGGFGGYGPSGPPPPGGGPAPKGQVADWIRQATEILKAHGYPVEKMNANDIWMIIQHESGGNPHAINNWDSNAAAGHPSKGLMQTIDSTFSRWALPGHGDIYNPVDNIIAAVRYAIERYGSVSNVPGVVGSKNGSGYVGY
ncbi:transglycosylase SLT domain-containing protein [Sphaerisporangium flaviroseum]|uniref:Transglycosylase SLT domain-containing protein n=1 Tax=Sphaerisporangium flaviroseum TaxID=509199 RepID=A0ABP7I8G7_9ACTN